MVNWREKIIRLTGGDESLLKPVYVGPCDNTDYCNSCEFDDGRHSRGHFCEEAEIFYINPTLAHVEDIKARLQKVPCGECKGRGHIIVCDKTCPHGRMSTMGFHCSRHGQCDRPKPCPTCEGKKHVDLWGEFVSHVVNEIDACECDFDDDTSTLIGIEAVIEIMTEVEYCGPAAVSFLEERNG